MMLAHRVEASILRADGAPIRDADRRGAAVSLLHTVARTVVAQVDLLLHGQTVTLFRLWMAHTPRGKNQLLQRADENRTQNA